MKNLRYLAFVFISGGIMFSCSTEPEPINYGNDACHFCEMTIVSAAHSAQAVSKRGKQFKYDAIECMVHDVIQNDTEMAVQQVADYINPGTMISVNEAGFVINDSINSPMGEHLAAIKKKDYTSDNSNDMFTWEALKAKFVNEKFITVNN